MIKNQGSVNNSYKYQFESDDINNRERGTIGGITIIRTERFVY